MVCCSRHTSFLGYNLLDFFVSALGNCLFCFRKECVIVILCSSARLASLTCYIRTCDSSSHLRMPKLRWWIEKATSWNNPNCFMIASSRICIIMWEYIFSFLVFWFYQMYPLRFILYALLYRWYTSYGLKQNKTQDGQLNSVIRVLPIKIYSKHAWSFHCTVESLNLTFLTLPCGCAWSIPL